MLVFPFQISVVCFHDAAMWRPLSRALLVSRVLYSAWVCGCLTQIHTLHQSMRDLRCDQQRLSDDLDREILRRNRYLKSEHKSSYLLTQHIHN